MCYLCFEITVEDANLFVNDGFKIGQTSLSLYGANGLAIKFWSFCL